MKKIEVSNLQKLMQYVHEVKLSYDVVTFRGAVPDPYTGTTEPFFIGRDWSKVTADERAVLLDLILPNGEKLSEVMNKIRGYYGHSHGFTDLNPDDKLLHLACHETHVKCRHYGGFCNYCFKLQQIIANPKPCPFFEEKIEK